LLKLVSILWATMATFFVSSTVTDDGFSWDNFKQGRQLWQITCTSRLRKRERRFIFDKRLKR